MHTTKRHSTRRLDILSGMAYQGYLQNCADRAKHALEPMAKRKMQWVERYGCPDHWRFQCWVHAVKRDLPDEGYMIAIPLDSKPE